MRSNGSAKSQYTYTLRHASLQDELVFKSLARFLMDLLRHQWRYEASDTADLVVVGLESASDGFNASDSALAKRVHIRVGADEPEPKALVRPLRVSAVLLALNLAGDEIAQQRAMAATLAEPSDPVFTLLRWPQLQVLRIDQRFMRITAVLAGKPSTLTNLAKKSSQPPELCERLLAILDAAGLLTQSGGANSSMLRDPATGSVSPADSSQSQQRVAAGVPHQTLGGLRAAQPQFDSSERADTGASLWGRIRRRLGIAVATSNSTSLPG